LRLPFDRIALSEIGRSPPPRWEGGGRVSQGGDHKKSSYHEDDVRTPLKIRERQASCQGGTRQFLTWRSGYWGDVFDKAAKIKVLGGILQKGSLTSRTGHPIAEHRNSIPSGNRPYKKRSSPRSSGAQLGESAALPKSPGKSAGQIGGKKKRPPARRKKGAIATGGFLKEKTSISGAEFRRRD